MKLFKPKFWDKKKYHINIASSSFINTSISNILNEKITFEYKLQIPVICIGNLYLGGTGKTPLSISLAIEL